MYSLKELKKFAKNENLQGYQNQTKKELADRLGIKLYPSREVLKNMARERGWKGYQNYTRKKLIEELGLAPSSQEPILDNKNPKIEVPILQPQMVKVNASEAPSIIQNTFETFSGWLKWLADSGKKYVIKPVSEKLKNLKEKINAIFQEKSLK